MDLGSAVPVFNVEASIRLIAPLQKQSPSGLRQLSLTEKMVMNGVSLALGLAVGFLMGKGKRKGRKRKEKDKKKRRMGKERKKAKRS